MADQILARVPGAEVAIIEDSAHCPPLDQPERLAELVQRFLLRSRRSER